MRMEFVTSSVIYGSALAAFVAALFWWWASVATVESDYDGAFPQGVTYLTFHGGRGPIQRAKNGKIIDITATAAWQARLNSFAAQAAAAAAVLQGVAIVLPKA